MELACKNSVHCHDHVAKYVCNYTRYGQTGKVLQHEAFAWFPVTLLLPLHLFKIVLGNIICWVFVVFYHCKTHRRYDIFRYYESLLC